jgi:hypothetical protein
MIMALILLRILVQFVAVLVALVGGLILCGTGLGSQAVGLLMTCGLIAWMARPDPEERAAFDDFQKQRLAKHGIEI